MGPVLGNPWSTAPLEQTLECYLRSTSRGRSLCLQNRAPEQFEVGKCSIIYRAIFMAKRSKYADFLQGVPEKTLL